MEMLGPARAVMIIVISQLIVAYLIELFGLLCSRPPYPPSPAQAAPVWYIRPAQVIHRLPPYTATGSLPLFFLNFVQYGADADGSAQTVGGEQPADSTVIWVHVCGAVRKAGVYELPAGSRVFEAVQEAGGFVLHL